MLIDANLLFTGIAGQAITSATTTNSTDTIDLAPLTAPAAGGAVNSIRDIGTGDNVYVVLILTTGSVTTVTTPTVRVDLQTADDTGFSVNASVMFTGTTKPLPTTTAAAAAGQIIWAARLPVGDWRRYIRAQIVTAGTITTASYTLVCGLTMGVQADKYYADAITIQ